MCGSSRATLKPGPRDLYSKRVFYLDEDSWVALAADQYDAKGQLYRSTLGNMTYSYDVNAVNVDNYMFYDFASGAYSLVGRLGVSDGMRYIEPLPELQWSSETLAGSGVRCTRRGISLACRVRTGCSLSLRCRRHLFRCPGHFRTSGS